MSNVKVYRDGNRLIVVVEDPTSSPEIISKINGFVLDVMGLPVEVEPMPGVKPVPAESTALPTIPEQPMGVKDLYSEKAIVDDIRDMCVGGHIVGQAVDNNDVAAICSIVANCNELDKAKREAVLRLCRPVLVADLRKRMPECTGCNEIAKFFRAYAPLIKVEVESVLNSVGYGNIDDFCNFSDEYLVQDAYASVIESLLGRIKS